MPSNINPLNINGAFPVAGQDNDSQGFRDNFTNTRTNLAFAASEITELQNKAVLRSSLGSSGAGVVNDLSGATLLKAKTSGFSKSVYTPTPPTESTTSLAIDVSNGDIQSFTTAGPLTLSFTGWPATGVYATCRLLITSVHAEGQGAQVGYPLTFPSSVTVGIATNPVTLAVGTYLLDFGTIDGGLTVFLTQLITP